MRFPTACTFSGWTCVAGAAALAVGACARVPTQSASMAASPEMAVSASQLQLQSFEMGRTLSTIIEQAADSIQMASADPTVRRNALLWKISAIPLIQEAALRNDPHVAAVDLLAFTIQLSDYLSTGSGRTSFGEEQPVAVAAAGTAEQAAKGLVAGSLQSGQLSATSEARLRQWAADHPMQGPALRRSSILNSDWQALGLSDNSFMATVGNVDRTLVNISYRLSYLNETMILEARWNAELSAEEAMRTPRVDSLLGAGAATLRSVGTLSDTLPALVDAQREALMRDIDLERIAMMRDVDRQRVLAFQDLAVQREALEAALSAERATLMTQVGQERTAAFLSADSLAQRSIDQSGVMLRRLALELTVAGLILVAALFGGGYLLINRWKATAA
jgi:hypothetical protein